MEAPWGKAVQTPIDGERKPGERLIVSRESGRKHPPKMFPAQTPVRIVSHEVLFVVPVDEVAFQRPREGEDGHDNDDENRGAQ